MLQYVVRVGTELEARFSSVERLLEYTEVTATVVSHARCLLLLPCNDQIVSAKESKLPLNAKFYRKYSAVTLSPRCILLRRCRCRGDAETSETSQDEPHILVVVSSVRTPRLPAT